MSTFFKALEQAERDRAGRQQDHPRPRVAPDPPPPTAVSVDVEPTRVERGAEEDRSHSAPTSPRPESTWRSIVGLDRAPAVATAPISEGSDGPVDEQLVSLLDPTSFSADQYRGLRHTVEELRRTAGMQVFAVSSPSVGDGKTTTAINLAGALAQAPDARVLLIEADLRQPVVAERLGLGNAPFGGLVDAILRPTITLADVVRRPPPHNLSVLLAGHPPASPYEILEAPRLGELIEEARRAYDYVLLDTPPIVAVPDCRVIGKWVDGFLIVVAAHQTSRRLLEEALTLMDPSKVIGLVFSREKRSLSSYGSYGAGTGQAYGHARRRARAAR